MSRTRIYLLAGLIALLGAGGATYGVFRHDMQAARSRVAQGGTVIATSTGQVEFAQTGTGPPLLSIHGAGGGYDQGLDLAGFAGEGFRVIAPSRFGYLRTPVPEDVSPAAQADAHAALLSKLGVPSAIVLGVSAGARSALELALRHPDMVRALVLIVPGTYAPSSPVSIKPSRGNKFAFWAVNTGGDFAWWTAEKIAPDVLIRFIGVPPKVVASAPAEERARVRQMLKDIEPLSLRFRGINIDSTPSLHELPLETIRVPTLIISARDDLFNTLPAAEHAASRITGAKLVIYETGGHLLVGQDARGVVRAFLSDAGLLR